MAGKGSLRVLETSPADVMAALERDAQNSQRHFVDEHEDVLVNEISEVEPILKDLLEEELLSKRQYTDIRRINSSQAKMRKLYYYSMLWDPEDKDEFFDILKKHNPSLIADLQSGRYKAPEQSELSAGTSSHLDEMDCDLCGKNQDPDDVVVVPTMQENTYRLELKSAGRFLCSETGIKFQVTGAVTIEYELDSWYNYMEFLQGEGSEVLGPLFNIKTPQGPNKVSAVYLPHYLCLQGLGGDTSWIKCAHFTNENLSVETPTRVLPFYILLENPSFSSIGAFCLRFLPGVVAQHIPLHGKVLLYFKVVGRKCIEYKIHLYLLPGFAPVTKEFEQEKEKGGFHKMDKPKRTRTVFAKKNYIVEGPEEAFINPTELEVLCISPLESFTEISIDAKKTLIDVCLVQESSKDKIWGCRMTRGEIEELLPETSSTGVVRVTGGVGFTQTSIAARPSSDGAEHFVDRHRVDLISRVSMVDPILDGLLQHKLLTYEPYNIVRSHDTSQEKMRALYSYVRGWGPRDKDVLYTLLEKENGPLIRDLQGK